jgi:hypothetical protein
MRLAQDILENYIGVESDNEEASGQSQHASFRAHFVSLPSHCLPGPSDFSFAGNAGAASYNFDGDASM